MSEGMLGLVPLDEIRGVASDVFGKLAGPEGPTWLVELKKFAVKQPCWVTNAVAEEIAPVAAPRQQALPVYPAVGQEFELTLDGDAPENQPLAMVQCDGYAGAWKHEGPLVEGKQTRRFKLVQVGYQPGLEAVRTALAAHGEVPPGQWREALKSSYRQDGQGPVGLADPSWQNPVGIAYFPYVHSNGDSNFDWAGDEFHDDWRWLVLSE